MIAIPVSNVKTFMNHLLCRSTFDAFCVSEVSLSTFASFHMDGHILKDYYTKEELDTLYKEETAPIARWKQFRPICYELIRGNHTPLAFSIILQLSQRQTAELLQKADTSFSVSDIHGLLLNLRYSNGKLTIVTGTSFKIFSTDRSLETFWDKEIQKFILSL